MNLSKEAKESLSRALYPVLLALPLGVWLWLWKRLGWDASIALQLVYWGNIAALFCLEQLIPFERAWAKNDGQIPSDLLYSVSAVVVNSLTTVACLWAISALIEFFGPAVSLNAWPLQWPFFLQVILGILLWDLGNHLAHRWAHKVPFLWRFHAVHHSAPRLSVVNTGRLHPFDVAKSVLIGAPIPVLLGVPAEVSLWYAAFNVFIGTLTHSNLDLRCGLFNHFLNTPNLHRWHHSPQRDETDTNFGEATIVWDRLFGTYLHPSRAPRRNVGLGGGVRVSRRFLASLLQPFTPAGHHAADADLIAELGPGEAGGVAGEPRASAAVRAPA